MLEKIDLEDIKQVALDAGKAIVDIYESDEFEIERKEDNSPLTKADKASNEIICQGLEQNYPQIPLMSEENALIAPFR